MYFVTLIQKSYKTLLALESPQACEQLSIIDIQLYFVPYIY